VVRFLAAFVFLAPTGLLLESPFQKVWRDLTGKLQI